MSRLKEFGIRFYYTNKTVLQYYTSSLILDNELQIGNRVYADVLYDRISLIPFNSSDVEPLLEPGYAYLATGFSTFIGFYGQPDSFINFTSSVDVARSTANLVIKIIKPVLDVQYIMFLGRHVCNVLGFPHSRRIPITSFIFSNTSSLESNFKGEIMTFNAMLNGDVMATMATKFYGFYKFQHEIDTDKIAIVCNPSGSEEKRTLEIASTIFTGSAVDNSFTYLNGFGKAEIINFRKIQAINGSLDYIYILTSSVHNHPAPNFSTDVTLQVGRLDSLVVPRSSRFNIRFWLSDTPPVLERHKFNNAAFSHGSSYVFVLQKGYYVNSSVNDNSRFLNVAHDILTEPSWSSTIGSQSLAVIRINHVVMPDGYLIRDRTVVFNAIFYNIHYSFLLDLPRHIPN